YPLNERSDRHQEVEGFPATARLVSVNAPGHTEHAWNVHQIKGQVIADEEQPEMQFADAFVQHSASHLRIPVIECAEDREQDRAHDYVMKVSNDKIRTA